MMMVVMVAAMPMTFAMAMFLVAIAVAVAPMMMMAVGTGNFCNDVERPDVVVASITDDGVGQEKGAYTDCDCAAIGLGWCCGACSQ